MVPAQASHPGQPRRLLVAVLALVLLAHAALLVHQSFHTAGDDSLCPLCIAADQWGHAPALNPPSLPVARQPTPSPSRTVAAAASAIELSYSARAPPRLSLA